MLLSILGFLAILGPLVVVHEMGHFLFARLFNVRAEIFSVGFGPVIWNRKKGETEYRLSLIPLGGFVKLFGEEPGTELPPEERARALQYAAPWKRFLIFFGGPLFNFLFAILVFMAIMAIGEPRVGNVIGRVVEDSAEERAGFQNGDRILEVNGKPVRLYSDMMTEVHEHPNASVSLKVLHLNTTDPVVIQISPNSESGFSMYGESRSVGRLDGLQPTPRKAKVGVSDPESLAAKAGMKTGDFIVSVQGQKLETWEEFLRIISGIPIGGKVELEYQKAGEGSPIRAEFEKKTASLEKDWGLFSSELFVEKAVEKSPAAASGLLPGDHLVAVDSKPIRSFFALRDAIQEGGEKNGKVNVTWIREGRPITSEIAPTATQGRDPLLNKFTEYTIGVAPLLAFTEPVMVIERTLNPFKLVYRGTARMFDFTWRNIVSIGKMVTGSVSVATLGGPILIGKLAGESIERGLIAFLTTMAILSVGLGILNVLPIPVLDGGHLLLLAIESVRGKPLSIRQMEVIQQVGLSLILLLMAIVIGNDLQRLPIFN